MVEPSPVKRLDKVVGAVDEIVGQINCWGDHVCHVRAVCVASPMVDSCEQSVQPDTYDESSV